MNGINYSTSTVYHMHHCLKILQTAVINIILMITLVTNLRTTVVKILYMQQFLIYWYKKKFLFLVIIYLLYCSINKNNKILKLKINSA